LNLAPQGARDTLQGGPRILVVEDQSVSDFLRSLLSHQGFQVTCANLTVARELLRKDRNKVDVLITNRPLEFTATPDVPVLYLSACPDSQAIKAFSRATFLAKPFEPRTLLECLRRLLPA